ncbi:alpha/beta hydrolase [Saccharibacillus alkalitolerans]|uniref:Alpha/beta hydrolase n=1 Tax=Saccharibacillus alkalitolerans TaxID=2705290 RepID=A0ABX0F6D7_9BACL|nr:alpha/beta hydrolase [Saccharibacillus alkalitolerans]NGZ76522.1 alpha/beta hydrolase [Saccharibacillus alkalitolerans]
MDQQAARRAANEMPEGTQILYGDFAEGGTYYSCTYHPDVVYATYEGVDRRLQIIQPQREGYKFPLVIFIQGSAWMKQNVYTGIPNLSQVAAKGYVIASVEIRDTGIARFPAAVEDVKCALRFMRRHAEEYGIDPKRAAVWGDSSGGHLSLMTGLTMGEYNNGLYGEESDEVLAVVDYYGITDLFTLGKYNDIIDRDTPDSPEGLFIGGRVRDHAELAKEASPLHRDLDGKLPPFLIVHGDDDRIVHVNQSIEMYKALRENGQNVLFYKVAGADHGTGVWSPQVLDITAKFLSTHLNRPMGEPLPFQHETE